MKDKNNALSQNTSTYIFGWTGKLCLILLLLIAGWYGGFQYAKHQMNIPLPLDERLADAVAKKQDNSQLYALLRQKLKTSDDKHECGQGQFLRIVIIAANNTQARLAMSCGDKSYALNAKVIEDEWQLLTTTNNFAYESVPLCSYVTENKLSKQIEPYCMEYGDGEASQIKTLLPNVIP